MARHAGVVVRGALWLMPPLCPPPPSEHEREAPAMTARHAKAQVGLYMGIPYPMKADENCRMHVNERINRRRMVSVFA